MGFRKLTFLLILTSLSILTRAQSLNTVSLSLSVKFDTFYHSQDLYPIAILTIKNIGREPIKINKKTILSPDPTSYSYFNTTIEHVNSDQKRECADSNDVAPIRCTFDFFSVRVNDYTINKVEVYPGQYYILDPSIDCYNFEKGKTYRVRVSIDKEKTGLVGTSEWTYFKMPY